MIDTLTSISQYYPPSADLIIRAVAVERDYGNIYLQAFLEILPVIIVLFAFCIKRINDIKLEEDEQT